MVEYHNQEEYEKLKLIIEYDWLQGVALGIAKQAISKGFESLTDKQTKVLNTYALKPFEEFDYADLLEIAGMGYDGENTKILDCAREIKEQLGYIPNNDAREEDLAYRLAVEEAYLL